MREPDLVFEPEREELREGLRWRFEVTRRQFLETAGYGLLLCAVAVDADGQTQAQGRVHVAAGGRVTVLSGKVEEGQGARAELAMAAAEELHVPLAQVTVQLADTDLTPNDGITAGSRTTPSTVPAVRKASAAARQLNDNALTPPASWKVLGRAQARPNGEEIVRGSHRFPSDIERPGMLYGVMLRPPAYGAKLDSIDTGAAKKIAGVQMVREGEFVGCVAPTSFQARQGVEALAAKWTSPEAAPSSATLYEDLKRRAKGEAPDPSRHQHHAVFHAAYVQHAPMEPRAAVAEWSDGRLTVWTGTSNPFSVRDTLAQSFQLRPEQVRVIVPDFGGGFGGKHTGEAAVEAARLAREAGKPVKVRWTRAEEFMWAYFRPAARIEVGAMLDAKGAITAWDLVNYNSGGSAIDTPYRIPGARSKYLPSDAPLRQGSYRALASTANNFARESFMDELAAAAGADPLDFRLAHLDNPRLRAVLEAAAEKFRWRERRKVKRAANRGIGLACGMEKNSVVAACVEVEVDPKTGAPRLLEICEAYECGAILNPANLRSQVEGCILMGLGAALREEIRFAGGKLVNGRFSAYRPTRFRDTPRMEIVLLDRKDADPIGAGETPIIAVAPAMANAMFDAAGKRVRSMPLRYGSTSTLPAPSV